MQTANDVTLAALRHLHGRVERGMGAEDLAGIVNDATTALGGSPEFALSLLNEASAYPHGSHQPQSVAEGSVILMDCGCTVHGYQSDISRTWVFGEANARQRKLWDTVKRGQQIASESAKIGVAVGALDDAVRKYYASEGWGPGTSFRDCLIAPGMASVSTVTSRPISCMGTRRRSRPACASPMSPASTFPANSACAWKIAGT